MMKSYQEYIVELGKKIKTYRIMKELSQEDLSDKTGISKRSISRLEQGESIQMDNLFKILIALDLGDNIDLLVPDQTRRPSYYLEYSDSGPQRVRKKRVKTTFKWGDESWILRQRYIYGEPESVLFIRILINLIPVLSMTRIFSEAESNCLRFIYLFAGQSMSYVDRGPCKKTITNQCIQFDIEFSLDYFLSLLEASQILFQ